MTTSKESLAALEQSLNRAAAKLDQVTSKKMFGCHALFADSKVFALVWKHGQIGLKLMAEADYEALLSLPGAGPWKAGPMQMAHWVLLPPTLAESPRQLAKWAKRAHAQALQTPAKKSAEDCQKSCKVINPLHDGFNKSWRVRSH